MRQIKIREASVAFRSLGYRVPLKFGSGVVDTITDALVEVHVEESRGGRRAIGTGEILLGDLWAFPSRILGHDERDAAMRELTLRAASWLEASSPSDHPLNIGMALNEAVEGLAGPVSRDLSLPDPIPPLAGLVCLSPLDAAVHDAFGRAYAIDTYAAYGPEMSSDLSPWLGGGFRGRYLNEFIAEEYRSPVPIWHLVGGLDKLRREEKTLDDPDDGLPVTLDEWIERDGVYCLKLKLRGNDLEWDIMRTREVYTIARECLAKKGRDSLFLSVDTNEQCESPEYCVAFLEKLRAESPEAFDALLYLEQPTERDLGKHGFDMRPVAAIKPVVADEGIRSLEDLDVAFDLGWSGVALKTCKGHTSALLSAAKAAAAGKIYTIQDLTNPGLALVHSVGLASRLSPLKGVEANARQFIPEANDSIADRFEGLARIRGGDAHWPRTTEPLIGLGY